MLRFVTQTRLRTAATFAVVLVLLLLGGILWGSRPPAPDLSDTAGPPVADRTERLRDRVRAAVPTATVPDGAIDEHPESALAGPGSRTLHVRVTDAFGEPVRGAEVWTQAVGGIPEPVGITREDGRLEVGVGPVSRIAYAVTHPRFARAVGTASLDVAGGSVHVLLGRGAYVHGVVETIGGDVPAGGVSIVGWELGTPPPLDARRGASAAYSRRTRMETDGTFRLGPFPGDAAVGLLAVGSGYVSTQAARTVEPGGDRVRIEMAPLYAVVVSVFWDERAPPPIAHCAGPRLGGYEALGLRLVADHGLVERQLAPSAPETAATVADGGRRHRWLLYARRDAETLGPLDFRWSLPGGHPLFVPVHARRVWGWPTDEDRVSLEPVRGEEPGSVRVHVEAPEGEQREARPESRRCHAATVHLTRRELVGDPHLSLDVPLYGPTPEGVAITDVPVGTYDVRLSSVGPQGVVQVSPPVVTVHGRRESDVIVRVSDRCGSIRLELPVSGFGHQGARVSLFWEAPDRPGHRVAHRSFERPPFVIPWLAPGDYRVEARVAGRLFSRSAVRAAAGRESVVELRE